MTNIKGNKDDIPLFVVLMQLRSAINEQYQNLHKRIKKDDPFQFSLCFILEKKQIKEREIIEKLGDDMMDFFKTSSIIFETFEENHENQKIASLVSFKFKEKYLNEELEILIKIYASTKSKCIRCFKHNVDKEGKICSACIKFVPEANMNILQSNA